MSDINKPNGEEVPKDKPVATEVEKTVPITPEAIIADVLRVETKDGATSEPTPTPKEGDEPAKVEHKPPAPGEVFAKIGDREFKSQEELISFATEYKSKLEKTESDLNSQKGFNGWLTGAVKKMRPDLFNTDGSIKSAELQKIVEGASSKASAAAETLKEHAGKEEAELTDEQKDDIKKARAILEPLGVVFKDDPQLKKMEEDLGRYRERDLDSAMKTIDEFAAKHPQFNDHRVAIGELMEQRGYDSLDKAWKVYKAEQDIVEAVETPVAPIKKDDDGGTKSVDTTIPTTVKKESGSLPSSGKRDLWDDVLAISVLPR